MFAVYCRTRASTISSRKGIKLDDCLHIDPIKVQAFKESARIFDDIDVISEKKI